MMKAFRKYASLLLGAVLLLALCAQAGAEKAPAASREVADASQMTAVEDVVEPLRRLTSSTAVAAALIAR